MQNDDSNMAANAICHAADVAKAAWQEATWEYLRPSVVFKPTLSKDGNMWCALFGDNLQEGEGLCTLAGTEHCDWDCPFNPCDPEGM